MTTATNPASQREAAPPCSTWLTCGWCVLPDGHDAGHLPLPVSYPPTPAFPAGYSPAVVSS